MENKSLLKARVNADVGAGKFKVAEGRNDRDSGGGGSSADRWRDKDARSTRSYTGILTRKSRRAQRGGNCEKSLTGNASRDPPPVRRVLAAE